MGYSLHQKRNTTYKIHTLATVLHALLVPNFCDVWNVLFLSIFLAGGKMKLLTSYYLLNTSLVIDPLLKGKVKPQLPTTKIFAFFICWWNIAIFFWPGILNSKQTRQIFPLPKVEEILVASIWGFGIWSWYLLFPLVKVHIFWEGYKILRNLHQLFDWQYIGQIIGGDFAKFCGLLRIYELYMIH